MPADNHFAGAYLDRRAAERSEDWLQQARVDPGTQYLLMRGGATLVGAVSHSGTGVVLLDAQDPRIQAVHDPQQMMLLGWYRDRRCVLLDVSGAEFAERVGEQFAELRPLVSGLPQIEAGLVAYARALNLWRAGHRYCGRCGALTQLVRAGHARHCSACGYTSFPRLDPAVIVLVHDQERALLGRQAGWPAGRYSTIAGFVEPGESLEDAVRREMHEETGVMAHDIAYHSSQPWPFPASLMLGFTATAVQTPPVLHDGELEDARWFTRAQLQSGSVLLPPPHAISRRLIDSWLQP